MRTIRPLACLAASLALWMALACPAFGDSGDSGDLYPNPCMPTVDQLEEWEADGSLSQRLDFQDALDNDEVSPGLVERALARQSGVNALDDDADWWDQTMASVGEAHVLGLRVSFPGDEADPDAQFGEGDTLEAFEALLNPSNGDSLFGMPYDTLSDYYYRSSYGRLSITGEAFDYIAKHERDYYEGDMSLLLVEALDALDGRLDYADFDADGDGGIDCVYIHFVAPNPQWGTAWWSNEACYMGPETFDGKRPGSFATLHNPCDSQWGVQTIIHETGHALGLPDLYSYRDQGESTTGRSGCLTFDMMDTNQGDHNALFKWMLGWIDDDDVTYIALDENGAEVRQGQTVVATYDAQEAEAGIRSTVSAFASDDAAEQGEVLVVSNDVLENGMFGSYYMLQYDRFGGNQSVYYRNEGEGAGENVPLPSGFRVFRVQAGLNAEGNGFEHQNTFGDVHSQLLELVDPDMEEEHGQLDFSTIPQAVGAGHYGCMYYAGDELTPEGYPSTNFNENIFVGFTGLTFQFESSDETQGVVNVSYSDDLDPGSVDFSMEDATGRGFFNVDTLVFEASSAPLLAGNMGLLPRIVSAGSDGIESVDVQYGDIRIRGKEVFLDVYLDAGFVRADRTYRAVFPAGMFVVGSRDGQDVLSPEVVVELDANEAVANAIEGEFSEVAYEGAPPLVSNIATCDDGGARFVLLDEGANGELGGFVVHSIDRENPSETEALSVSGMEPPAEQERGDVYLEALSVEDGLLLVALVRQSEGEVECSWVDLADGNVVRSQRMDVQEFWEYRNLILDKPSQGSLGLDLGFGQYFVDAVRYGQGALALVAEVSFESSGTIYTLIELDAEGAEVARSVFSPVAGGGGWKEELSVGPDGTIAITSYRPLDERPEAFSVNTVWFFNEELEFISQTTISSNTAGVWLEDGRWMNTCRAVSSPNVPAGSPVGPGEEGDWNEDGNQVEGGDFAQSDATHLRYVLVDPISANEEPKPPVSGDGESSEGANSDSSGEANGDSAERPKATQSLAATGDRVYALPVALCCIIALFVGVYAASRLRGNR